MASSWRYGKRSKYRAKISYDPEETFRLDPKKSLAENAFDIYTELCNRKIRDTKRLFLLNALSTLCQQHQQQQHTRQQKWALGDMGFTLEELLYCLSANLVHSFAQVRAGALRAIRYALATPKDIKIFNSMQLQHLLCRSIDIYLKNDDERVQALKLVRKMLAISAADISPVIVRCLVSLADSSSDNEHGDSVLRACLATLCEFAVLNPTLLIICGGVTSITRNILDCHNPRIAESLCGVLLYMLEWPQTRYISGVRLDCLAAPYCDFTYRQGTTDKNKDAREFKYTSCRLALLSILRSWAGTIEFCDPSKPSGLKAMVDALYLNQIEVRKAILELFYELLGLPQPTWTDDYVVAMQIVDPCDFQVAWLLSNGFVAMEGRCILPSLAARAPNVCTQHLALQLYCFLETGLLDALVEVIVAEDVQLSVSATVLLGKVLQLIYTHLPGDICSSSAALPTLIAHATKGNSHATAAITVLQNYQKMLRNRPATCSLFLDSIVQQGSLIQTRLFRRELNSQSSLPLSNPSTNLAAPLGPGLMLSGTLDRRQRLDSVSSEDSQASSSKRSSSFRLKKKFLPFLENYRVNKFIKDSNVLATPDWNVWDWEVVIAILRSNLMRKLDDNSNKFLRSLADFFKPSMNRFSHQDLSNGQTMPKYVFAGIDLIDWLLGSNELESIRILTDMFCDISKHLLAVSTSNRAHDCLFSPQHMNNTMCQLYFLYIGRMCRVQKGIDILTNSAVYEHLISLIRNTDHVCYVKLIVSGLDYTQESKARKVLEKALTEAKTRSGRLYATQFLTVLLRARLANFEVWGIRMIIQQTKDPDRAVVLAAMDVLEEACHEKYYLEEIVNLWPNFKGLGDIGRILMCRYYSLPRGLNHSKSRIKNEIEYWKNGYNKKYVLIVEADTHASLTLHVRNGDGCYSRRNCNTRPVIIPPNMPPHLYGQMAQTAQGMSALKDYGDLPRLVEVISCGKCSDDVECLELKSAIWAVGHASTHTNGIEYFVDSGSRIYEKIIILATKCEVYSIRATSFHVLGLIGGTVAGANLLVKLNWLSVRHDRNTIWPVHQLEDCSSNNYTPVRHHCEDVPPYNYSSMEEQIDGIYNGSYWNLLLSGSSLPKGEAGGVAGTTMAAESSGGGSNSSEAVDSFKVIEDASSKQPQQQLVISASVGSQQAKSRTLPEGITGRHGKHQRSLSESKTTDFLCLLTGGVGSIGIMPPPYQQQQHNRIRYNSCTDSNTSGVSSCESVTGKAGGTSDFQQFPLSPIPSMSNLLETPPKAPLLRRTSLIGTSYMQNTISPADIRGYAQLRSLRRYCRPVLSESATDFYDIVDSKASNTKFSIRETSSLQRRSIKVRSLDRHSSLKMYTQLDMEDWQPLPPLAAPKFLSQNDSQGPCYAGIALPKNIYDIFPRRDFSSTYVSRDIQDQDIMDLNSLTAKRQLLTDSVNNEGGDESSVISSLSDVSSVSKRSKWLGANHGRNNCLYCSRCKRNNLTQTLHHLDSDMALNEIYASGMSGADQMASGVSGKRGKSFGGAAGANITQNSSTVQLSDISFNSRESILSEESMPDRLTAQILYNVQRLANPVSSKQSRMALLELRQKYPATFQDICLYSEVCRTLGRSRYRMNARRFLQELFLDLNFDVFYNEPLEILAKKEKEFAREEKENIAGGAGVVGAENRLNIGPIGSGEVVDHEHILQVHQQPHGHLIQSTGTVSHNASAASATTSHASHKPHLKSQPLASVYETSCENLLMDQSPQQNERQNNAGKSKFAERSPPQDGLFREELFIHSDDDDDEEIDDEDVIDGNGGSIASQQDGQCQNLSATVMTVYSNSTTTCASTSQSRCSYATTPFCNSNCSSICAISHQPSTSVNTLNGPQSLTATTTPTTPIENDNKVYTRGRFYTLELDLSCTKNKFPIKHRELQQNLERNAFTATTPTNSSTAFTTSSVSSNRCGSGEIKSPTELVNLNSWHALTCDTNTTATAKGLSNFQPPYEGLYPGNIRERDVARFEITKSLAASLAKPIGSLYCEKRLQSCKSEAVLPNLNDKASSAHSKVASTGATAAAHEEATTMPTTNHTQGQT